MISDDLAALALADSVGALDSHERTELAARRAALSLEQQAELGHLYDVAAALATAADALDPPAHVRQRVLATARASTRARANAASREATLGPGWVIRTKSGKPPQGLCRNPR